MRLLPSALRGTAPALATLLLVPFAPAAHSVGAGDDVALTRALECIDPDKLSADLHFLACDELGGRDSPSLEQRIAARFLVNRVKRLGLAPGAPEGFLWEYGLPTVVVDMEKTTLVASKGEATHSFELGADYGFFPQMLTSDDARGAVVFAGELRGDEQDAQGEPIDLKGAWALCTSHDDVSFRDRIRTAREAGAIGVIVTPSAGGEAEMARRCAGYARQLREPRLSRGQRSSRRSFPYIYMTEDGLRGLLRLAAVEELALGQRLSVELSETRGADDNSEMKLENVCALWRGSDPILANEVIIVSAHYDHVGRVEETGEVFNGADDNGSGTAGLLAIGEALTRYGPMRRSVLLMWVSAEEKGLLGSRAWTEDPWLPEGMKPALNLNIDMIGRNAPEQILVTPTKQHDAYNFLTRMVEKHAGAEGFTDVGSADDYWGRSDHANFSKNLGLPVAFLFADIHEDYHRVTDTPDKINYEKLGRVVKLVLRMLDDLQGNELGG